MKNLFGKAKYTVLEKNSHIFSTEDARRIARKRLPRMVFDFIEGAAGREVGVSRNEAAFDNIMLQPRVMENVSQRSLTASILDQSFNIPFGVAPMGMCNLACPNADRFLAEMANKFDFPVCLSSAASSSIEDMAKWAGHRAWFQLYFSSSEEASMSMVDRALKAGFETLVLTVDVPQVSRRVRDLRNGFNLPFSMTPRAFWDFATHPRWSLRTLTAGAPSPRNFVDKDGNTKFNRGGNRAGANWDFFQLLRKKWPGKLIVKGVTSTEDAQRVQSLGADAIYVSNHGGRQLDSVPPTIQLLPLIRSEVGSDFPLLFDSGVRNGEDVVKALALGADFVMLGRPALLALGAEGVTGLNALLKCFTEDISVVLAQLGMTSINDLKENVIFNMKAAQ